MSTEAAADAPAAPQTYKDILVNIDKSGLYSYTLTPGAGAAIKDQGKPGGRGPHADSVESYSDSIAIIIKWLTANSCVRKS